MSVFFNYQLYGSFAPYVFCIEYIDLIANFHACNIMAFNPFLVLLHPFKPLVMFLLVAIISLSIHNQFNCVINHERFLQDSLPNDFSALRAFLLSNEALSDALVAERMTTYSYPTVYDQIHTYGTSESFHLLKRNKGCFLLLSQFINQA